MRHIIIAIKKVFSDRRYSSASVLIAAVIFSILFLVQVKTIPGNSVHFQVALFGWKDWLILASISILNALFITIEIYIFNLKHLTRKLTGAGARLVSGGVGTSSGVLASIFGTATCGLCVSALFSFLGANTIVYLVEKRGYIVAGSLFLLVLSLYLSSKRFSQTCDECHVD